MSIGDIARLSRECFPARLHSWLIHCQPGYNQYAYGIVASGSRHYWVAEDDGELVGFAEWREMEDTSFLNHICVSGRYRGAGIGRSLIGQHLANKEIGSVALDVFVGEPAQEFYRGLGFTVVQRRRWMIRQRQWDPRDAVSTLDCSNVEQWRSEMNRFGFGKLLASWRGDTVSILFSSRHSVRLPSVDLVMDDALLESIHNLAPEVRRYATIADLENDEVFDETFDSVRMTANVQDLRL